MFKVTSLNKHPLKLLAIMKSDETFSLCGSENMKLAIINNPELYTDPGNIISANTKKDEIIFPPKCMLSKHFDPIETGVQRNRGYNHLKPQIKVLCLISSLK